MGTSGADNVHTRFDVFNHRETGSGLTRTIRKSIVQDSRDGYAATGNYTMMKGLSGDCWFGVMSAGLSWTAAETDMSIRELAQQRALA